MGLDIDNNDTEELRHHIHRLLRDYSRTYYTTDYIEFTESLVAEFVEGLKPIPLTDPSSLLIPADPFDVFCQVHGLSSLAPYEETFKHTTEARLYLKQVMVSPLGIPKTEQVVWDDDYGRNLPSYQPIFVAQSRKSRQSTPKLGSKKQSHSPDRYRDLLKSQKIEPISVEEIEDPLLSFDKILQLELKMDDEDRPAVKSLLQSTYKMLRHQEGYKNKYLDTAFLHANSSAEEYKFYEDFIPIFPRARMPGSGTAPTTSVSTALRGLTDVSPNVLLKVAVGYSDDIPMHNMAVIDGWETIRSSLPSTPSSMTVDDSDDQVDELLFQSTPKTESAAIDELFNVQMEVPQFPRSRKLGGYAGIQPHILAGKTLGTFLQPLLPKTAMQINEEPLIERCSSPAPSSLFGQPPSALEPLDKEESSSGVHGNLDTEIEILYKDQKFQDFIMDEAIDEEQIFLMEVPDLPEPNVYARKENIFPTKFSEFLVPPDLKCGEGLPNRFLKKTSKQSLNVALSWVAFTIDKKLPTITEIADITDLFDDPSRRNGSSISMDAPSEADLTKADMLLRSVNSADSPPNPMDYFCCLDVESSDYRPPDPDGFKMLLNRSERRRVTRLSDSHRYCEPHSDTEYLQGPENDDMADRGSFQSLSLESRLPVSTLSSWQALSCPQSGLDSNENQHDLSMDALFDLSRSLLSKVVESRSSTEMSTESEMALRTQTFAQLRAKKITQRNETELPVPAAIILPPEQDRKPRETPADLYDSSTVRLPESITMPQSIHKYMASLDIIQKQALVRSLKSPECLVDLVERQSLDGVDLVLDHRSAVIFLSLFMLSVQCDRYVERVAAQSWKFRRIMVIFEAYPQSCARKGNKTFDADLDAYTPPILKAIKKFRRSLIIAAACGIKCQETEVLHVFANSVDEGALFARLYGNFVEENDETGGAIWGDRGWLDVDFLEDEEAKLASVDGMNRFSASIVLCQVSLQDFLDTEPEERIARFGGFIGADNVEKFNADLERRSRAMEALCTSE